MIEVLGVTKTYQTGSVRVEALNGVTMRVDKGEFLALSGPSGSGKTTLLNLIGCLDSIGSGEITVDGIPLSKLNPKERNRIRKEKIGFVFQSYNLIPVLTARENVALALELFGDLRERDIIERADAMLAEVGLSGLEKRRPTELSGGQQQRVSIARALVKKPPVILADEPTANLDSKTGEEILALMDRLNRELGVTFVFSTHDRMVMARARRVVSLHDGKIVADSGVAP